MRKILTHTLLISMLALFVSCKSDQTKAIEVLDAAIAMDQGQGIVADGSGKKLPIQNSAYSGPIKKAPSQEELIKKFKVKTVKETYPGGWSISTYDQKGNVIAEESDYSGKRTYSYAYDRNGNVIEEKTKHNDGSTSVRKYAYDDKGRLISKSFTSDMEEYNSVTGFVYDDVLNTRTESSSTGKDKEFYDNRGLRVRFESYGEKGKLVGFGDVKYDEDGLRISETGSLYGMPVKDVFEYNENAQPIKQHRTGMVDVDILFEYNAKGLLTKSTNIRGQQVEETVYAYTFH